MSRRYPPAWLPAAIAFGVAAGIFKGNEVGLRAGIGNLSAPWLLLALLPGMRCDTPRRGAVTGLGATLAALLGFYAALTGVLAGQLGGGGPLREFVVEASANRIYFLAGLVTGPLFGALGALLGRRAPRSGWVVAGALLMTEIAVVAAAQGHQLLPAPVYFSWAVDDWRPYVGESLIGAVMVVAALWRIRRRQPLSPDHR